MARKGTPRIFVQAGVHPSETTSFFVNEGFIPWLLSSAPEAQKLLDMAVVSVVPMCNPDGVYLGNYRTNSESVNLEDQYAPPYNPEVKEVQSLIRLVEDYMGSSEAPGEHPIMVFMNLHSTHYDPYPYHFVHEPFYEY